MLLGLGVDLMDVARMERQSREGGFVEGLFTPREIAYCAARHSPAQHFAARFAAKEAFFKALGVDGKRGLSWREVEVVNQESGRPELTLHGETLAAARKKGVKAVHLSLSHAGGMAIAQLILES
jgi:holo-[acyl-carrier protein] synthase